MQERGPSNKMRHQLYITDKIMLYHLPQPLHVHIWMTNVMALYTVYLDHTYVYQEISNN